MELLIYLLFLFTILFVFVGLIKSWDEKDLFEKQVKLEKEIYESHLKPSKRY